MSRRDEMTESSRLKVQAAPRHGARTRARRSDPSQKCHCLATVVGYSVQRLWRNSRPPGPIGKDN
jgi:hypothetical protein